MIGFYCIADLLRAAEIVAAITPEGYEYESVAGVDHDLNSQYCWRRVNFRRIAPPVEYEYVTDGKVRKAKLGDYIALRQGMVEVGYLRGDEPPQLCFRRVEVKR